jgi:hypothetical protein
MDGLRHDVLRQILYRSENAQAIEIDYANWISQPDGIVEDNRGFRQQVN